MSQTIYPIGIQNFEKIRKDGYLYIDKTALVYQLVTTGQYYFLSRPRRFGKSLLLSTLEAYFQGKKELFEGLAMEKLEKDWKEYPILHFDLNISQYDSPDSLYKILNDILSRYEDEYGTRPSEVTLPLRFAGIIDRAYRKTGQRAVILIDEYDKPLLQNLHDEETQNRFRNMLKPFYGVLKTMDRAIRFALLTGVTKFGKVSVFSDLNNLDDISMREPYAAICGITETELRTHFDEDIHTLASALERTYEEARSLLRKRYDGYHFGNTDIYCPWDVIRYCKSLCADPTAKPQDFWSNSSGNALVRSFIDKADVQTKDEIERLIAGEYIEKEISQELTYDEIDKSIANLWSVLFTTGYLTKQGVTDDGRVRLSIPNREIKNLFIKKIREWFSDTTANDGKTLEQFCNAFLDKDTEKIEQLFGDYLWNTISIRDTAVAKDKKENFYHGILLGLLGYKASWLIKSNTESGTSYSDILVEVPNNRTGIVIELKYAENGDMDAACDEALNQIEEKSYVDKLKQDGMRNFIKYGIACFKKDCKVVVSE